MSKKQGEPKERTIKIPVELWTDIEAVAAEKGAAINAAVSFGAAAVAILRDHLAERRAKQVVEPAF